MNEPEFKSLPTFPYSTEFPIPYYLVEKLLSTLMRYNCKSEYHDEGEEAREVIADFQKKIGW